MMKMYDFEGKIAIITGCAQGIGQAVAFRLAKEGATVALFDLPDKQTGNATSKLKETYKQIVSMGSDAMICPTDVTNVESVKKSFKAVLDQYGKLDFLVNAAGIAPNETLEELTPDVFEMVLKVNTTGTFLTNQCAAAIYKKQKYGKIVNFSSINGITGYMGSYPYNASKFGVMGLTHTFAFELGAYGCTVNAVCPGYIWTPMWANADRGMFEKAHPGEAYVPMQMYKEAVARTCLKRACDVNDVSAAVAFLLSDEARNITGQHINVDSGVEFH